MEFPFQAHNVSVIIPAYNPRPRQLMPTLESIALQNGNYNVEVIVVDDGSERPYKPTHHLPGMYIEIPHRGVSAARNAGIEAAAYPNILCIDVGDSIHRDFLSRTMPLLSAQVPIVYVPTQVSRSNGQTDIFNWGDYSLSTLRKYNFMPITSLFRREVYDAVKAVNGEGFDTKVMGYEDWLFWLEAGLLGFYGKYAGGYPLFFYILEGSSRNERAMKNEDVILEYMDEKLKRLYGKGLWLSPSLGS